MLRYDKIMTLKGSYYTKEYETIKHHKNKIREIREEVVIKSFLKGDTEILVHFEETGKELLINDFSDPELIKKYLGPQFLTWKV